jgi:hypothetical protein
VLYSAGLDGWTVWPWLTRPSDELAGAVPERIADTSTEPVLLAATRFAASHGASHITEREAPPA